MKKFRIHVLGLPHTKTNKDYVACAFTQKCLQFCKMMHERGHYIIHYGVEGSDPECDENVVVLSDELYTQVYGRRSKVYATSLSIIMHPGYKLCYW